MVAAISLAQIDAASGRRLGTFDVPCPLCGPFKRAARNQRREVLRVFRVDDGFAGFHCARCGESGYTRDRDAAPPDPIKLAHARAAAAERARLLKADRLGKAQALWARRRALRGSIAETYLRRARGYGGPLPATLGFIPARGDYPPAMIAAFGLAHEIEPGVIAIADAALRGVHLTRLLPDGSGKATFEDPDEQAKIMIGYSAGWPIVLAPPNDLLGMAITEGIEDALSAHEATGLGAWAAGCASRLPPLADVLPSWIDCVTVLVDDDPDGHRHAPELAKRIRAREIEARLIIPNTTRAAAA